MATGFSHIHPDIIQTQILPRLDGCELATMGCVSPELRSLSTSHQLWSHICSYTWPSTNTPRLQGLISSFPRGPHSFFSLAFPLLHASDYLHRPSTHPPPNTLISAVDLFYKGNPILSKTQETETTLTDWFRSAPLRIDLLDTKELIPTPIPNPSLDDTSHHDLYRDLKLSWIVIDPTGRRALNVSSMTPVSVQRHWLMGELQARFATVMNEGVVCVVDVAWAAVDDEEEGRMLKIREVSLEIEDLEGTRLTGKQSIEILQRGLESGRRVGRRHDTTAEEGDGRRRKYEEFMKRRRERKERRKRDEVFWDKVYIATALVLFSVFFLHFFRPI